MSGDRFARCAAERGRRDRVVDRDGDRVLDELARLIRQRPAQRPAPFRFRYTSSPAGQPGGSAAVSRDISPLRQALADAAVQTGRL